MRSSTWGRLAVVATVLASPLFLLGCGDDGGGGDLAAYCAFSEELDESEDVPSNDQFDRLADLAPSEIRDEVSRAVGIIKDEGEAAFGNDQFLEDIAAIEAFEEANCT